MKDAGEVRSESLKPIDLGQVVQQPLHVGGHGRGLGHVGAGRVEPGLVSVVLHLQQRGRLELSTNIRESNSGPRRPLLLLGPAPRWKCLLAIPQLRILKLKTLCNIALC